MCAYMRLAARGEGLKKKLSQRVMVGTKRYALYWAFCFVVVVLFVFVAKENEQTGIISSHHDSLNSVQLCLQQSE